MERLEKVHQLIQDSGLNEMTVLDELLRWMSESEVNEFVEDFKRTWDVDYFQKQEELTA